MAGENLDFQTVYVDFQPRIQRYLTRMVGELEAEDLSQDVFIKINKSLKSFRGESQLSTWIYRIATHAAIDQMRKVSFRQGPELSFSDQPEDIEDQDTWSGEEVPALERQLMRKEMQRCFMDYVKQLPANYRTVVVLSELEELSNQMIADILGLSLEVVKIRLHRGRSRLLHTLKEHCQADDWL